MNTTSLISHCHTYHSFDSQLQPSDILSECLANSIDAIILNDHDVCLFEEDELHDFFRSGITVYKAIEFTTSEGVHIIGVHKNIDQLMKAPFYYTTFILIDALNALDAVIILPHPSHNTGVLGNKKISSIDSIKAIDGADAFEVDNYRYGTTNNSDIEFILSKNPGICCLVGSDAHFKSEVSAYINIFDSTDKDLKLLLNSQPRFLRLKKRGFIYFYKRKIKKTSIYQFLIKLFTPNFRRKIKNFLRL